MVHIKAGTFIYIYYSVYSSYTAKTAISVHAKLKDVASVEISR